MERNLRTNATLNLVVLVLVGGAALATARYFGTLAGQVGALFLLLGGVVAAVSRCQMGLEERERLERLDLEQMSAGRADAALFKKTETELYPARRAREQFEKFFVPGLSVALLGVQLGGAWWLWGWLGKAEPGGQREPVIGMALLGLFALVLFLLGKYAASLSRLEKQRLLRPGAGYLLMGAYLCGVGAAALGAAVAGYPKVDPLLARVLAVLLAVVGLENLATLIFEIYRPRVPGQEARLLYESRLVGLAGQPEGLFTTAAQALDYQFGFKVSETWFYQFLKKYLGCFVLAQLAVLLLSSCFVFIAPGEQAILERFGRPVEGRTLLNPGPHLKWPWPVDQVYRHRTEQIQTFRVGFSREEEEAEEGHGHGHGAGPGVELWSVAHYKEEFNMLVASREESARETGPDEDQAVPVSLLAVNVPVQYQVTNLLAYATNYADAGALLENLAMREVVRYLVNVDLNEVMTTGRNAAALELRRRIQERANELALGVKIVFVGLQNIHPPVKIAPAYQAVIAALQEKEARILEAEGYAAGAVPRARAEAARRRMEAEIYAQRTAAEASARAAQFTNRLAAYQAAPEVFALRQYLGALERGGQEARKVVLAATNTQDVIILNLEEKLRLGLEDVPIPAPKQK